MSSSENEAPREDARPASSEKRDKDDGARHRERGRDRKGSHKPSRRSRSASRGSRRQRSRSRERRRSRDRPRRDGHGRHRDRGHKSRSPSRTRRKRRHSRSRSRSRPRRHRRRSRSRSRSHRRRKDRHRRHRRRRSRSGSSSSSDDDAVPSIDLNRLLAAHQGAVAGGFMGAGLGGMGGAGNPLAAAAAPGMPMPFPGMAGLTAAMAGPTGIPLPPTTAAAAAALLARSQAMGMGVGMGMGMGVGAAIPNAQATKPMRELHVGNLPAGVLGPQLGEYLNQLLLRAGLAVQPGNPIVQIHMSSDGNFAFAEFRTPEECTSGLLLNGLPVAGAALRVERPKSFTGAHTLPVAPPAAVAALTAAGVPPASLAAYAGPAAVAASAPLGAGGVGVAGIPLPPGAVGVAGAAAGAAAAAAAAPSFPRHTILLQNIPPNVTEEQVRLLVAAFGEVRRIKMAAAPAGSTAPSMAVFEYRERSKAREAMEGLSTLTLGPVTLAASRAADAPAELRARLPSLAPALPELTAPSRVVRLAGMVTVAQLADDAEYEDIVEDVREECAGMAAVRSLRAPRPSKKGGEEGGEEGENEEEDAAAARGVGMLFVEFAHSDGAAKAIAALRGRLFDGRRVEAVFYPERLFEAGVLTDDAATALEEMDGGGGGGAEEGDEAAGEVAAKAAEPGVNGEAAAGETDAADAGTGEGGAAEEGGEPGAQAPDTQ